MNKTMTMAAVALSVITALFLVTIAGGSDGAAPSGYATVSDADTVSYTDSTLPGTQIYITSSSIGADAFKNCVTLTKVVLSDDVKTVGDSAFEGCSKLNYVVAENVTSIGDSCFKGTGSATFYFSSCLESVGANAFQNCKGIGPYLFGTGVTVLKAETFKGSSVKFVDLRGVVSIAGDAFNECTLRGQFVDEGQSVKVGGVPEIVLKDVSISGVTATYNINSKVYKLSFFTEDAGVSLKFTDSTGTQTLTTAWSSKGNSCLYTFNDLNLTVQGAVWTIHFPEMVGMADGTHRSGEGTYEIPYPTLANNLFQSWNIRGESGARTTITEAEFANLDSDIYLEATYGKITVTYDHSALPDSTGLAKSGTFDVGDSYPTLSDIDGYRFSGWKVGTKSYSGGDIIVTYRDHTAVSQWNATFYKVSVVSLGETVATKIVEPNGTLELSGLSVTVPESKILMGWSLEENGALLTSDPTIGQNCSIYAVYQDREQYSIRYLDGQTVLGTSTAYSGSTFRIAQDNPVKEGMVFQNWELGDTGKKYYKGETILIEGDVDLKAVWNTVKIKVEYILDTVKTEQYDYGTEVTIGHSGAVKQGFTLQGWSLSSEGDVLYADGAKVTLTEDIKLYPIWKENGRFTVTVHRHDGTSSTVTVEQGGKFTVPQDSGWPLHVFDGWALTDNGNVAYVSGDQMTIYKDTDLYEIWHSNNSQPAGYTATTTITVSSDPPLVSQSSMVPSSESNQSDSTAATASTTTIASTKVTLRLMSGSVELDSFEVEKKAFDLTSAGIPVKTGYKFLGWSKNENTGGIIYTSLVSITGNTTLYAVWDKLMNVTYHDDTNTFNETVYCEKGGSLVLKTMERPGYEFKGWSENGSSTILSGSITVSRDMDLYPQWAQIVMEGKEEPPTETQATATAMPIDTTQSVPLSSEVDADDGGSNMTLIAFGAATAAVVSILVVIQLRRA